MASITMSATSASPISMDDSEESFVVLSGSPDQASIINNSLMTNMISYPTMPEVPMTDEVSQVLCSVSTNSVTSELSAEEIQSKLQTLLQENLQLKDTLHQNNLTMKKQFSILAMWQEDVQKVHQSHKEKFEETKKLIAHLKTENADLKKCVSLPCSTNEPGEEALNLRSKISALEFELDTLRQANIKHKGEQSKIIQELERKLSESEKSKHEELTKCNTDIDSLNSQFKSIQEQFNLSQQQLTEARGKIPTEAEIASVEDMKKQIKELVTELVLKNKILVEKTELIDTLHEDISRLKIENETIPILKTQVEVYQTDFNSEREARNALKTEKDRLADDLHHLQRRNQKLLEQVESLQRDDKFVHVVTSPTSGSQGNSSRTTPTRQSPPLASYSCPVCETKFRTQRLVEEHIEICLQNSTS